MPRTWGYIFIVVAIVIGAGALLLPVPETVEVTPVEPTRGRPAVRQPAVPSAPARERGKPARKPKPDPAPVPLQDTTNARQLLQPVPR